MRYIPLSGGWALGSEDGPAIDVIPVPGTPPLEREDLPRVLDMPFMWEHLSREVYRLTPSLRAHKGLMGYNTRAIIRFAYPRGQNPLDALYRIEEDSPTDALFFSLLIGQVWGAHLGIQRGLPPEWVSTVGHTLGRVCGFAKGTGPGGRLRSRDIEGLADRAANYLMSHPTEDRPELIPQRPVNRARFWLALSKRLWQPSILKSLSAHPPESPERWSVYHGMAWVASLHLLLAQKDRVAVGETSVSVGMPTGAWDAWLQVLEWTAGDIPDAVLRRLVGEGIRGPWPELAFVKEGISEDEAARSLAVAEAMLGETKKHGRYAPSGLFRVDLPLGVPLTRWEVSALRVWASPEELWVQALSDDATGPVFQWRPDRPPRAIVLSPYVTPVVHATLAALWHDLCVASERAFPAKRRKPTAEKHRRETAPAGQGSPKRERAVRLPRTVYTIAGRRVWGRDDDRRAVRQAHRVREHLRRLPPGYKASDEAKTNARAFGYILPEGYTFVRPHARGRGDISNENPAEPRVIARGLVTVATLLGKS